MFDRRLPGSRLGSLGAFALAAALGAPLVAPAETRAGDRTYDEGRDDIDGAPAKNTVRRRSDAAATASAIGQQVYSSLNVPKNIPDNDANGATSTLTVSGVGPLADVDLFLDNVAHLCVTDLHVELTSPAGTTVVLLAASIENGLLAGLSCPDNFISTVLDDQAETNLRAGTPPYTGRFNLAHASVGTNPLSAFNGENADGTWTLHISDRLADDAGELDGWSLGLMPVPLPVYASADVPKPIPDNDPIGITSTLEVTADGSIEDLDLILDNITHACVADLQIALTSPSQTTVVLIVSATGNEDGLFLAKGCPDNFLSTVLDDQSPVNLADGMEPYSGHYNIEHRTVVPMPLSQFNGTRARGTWTLSVKDLGSKDAGILNAWSLRPKLGPSLPCDGDFDHGGTVTIDELITAVRNALDGCP